MRSILLLMNLCFSILYATNHSLYQLTVTTTKLHSNNGVVQFALYNKEGTIPDKTQTHYFKKIRVKITDKKATATFKDLPKGRYALSVYHDENNNGKIDKGMLLPTEGVGLSNFTSIDLFHLPDFKSASFKLDKDKTVPIHLHYF